MRFPRSLILTGLCLLPFSLNAQTTPVPASPATTVPTPGPFPVPAPASTTAATTAPTTPASPITAPSDEMIESLSLHDAPLDLVLDRLAVWTGRTILRPTALPAATITLNITRPITKDEAVRAVESVLNLNGIGAVEMGTQFLKIVALAGQARAEAPEMITGSTLDLPPSGQLASKVFELNNLKTAEVVPQLNTLLNLQLGGAAFFPTANAFLVTDSITNLQRVEHLLKVIDRPAMSNSVPKFYQLHFAKASDIVTKIQQLLKTPDLSNFGNSSSLNADDRTNQIILLSDPKQYDFYDKLITKLDIVADPNTENSVIYLKHATAKAVATLLSTIITGQNSALAKNTNSATRTAGQANDPAAANGRNGQNAQAGAAATSTAAATGPVSFTNAGAAPGTTQFSPLLTVAEDDRSNSIVVSGTLDDIRLIRDLVNKIDIVLPQVRIEVVIAEVTLTDTDSSGISALNLGFANGGQLTTFSGTGAAEPSVGTPGWTITNGVVNPLAFNAALNTMGVNNRLKVLSAPTIVTTTNNAAEVIVGESLPIITGSTSTPNTVGSGLTTSSTVTYKDIAIDLKVTPIIGDDGLVQLTIDQQVNDIVGNVTIDGNSQPIIGKREATAFINVQDGQMIVLGGLQQTQKSDDKGKLGFIREIPVLSWLFGSRSKSTVRTELLLFIRPHILSYTNGTAETNREINTMSNHDDIKGYLKDTDLNVPVTPTNLKTTVIEPAAKH